MKVRDLVEALQEQDQERTVVVPWSLPKTARECVEVREVDMTLADRDDYVPLSDRTRTGGRVRVVALAPARRGEDKPEKPEEKSDAKD